MALVGLVEIGVAGPEDGESPPRGNVADIVGMLTLIRRTKVVHLDAALGVKDAACTVRRYFGVSCGQEKVQQCQENDPGMDAVEHALLWPIVCLRSQLKERHGKGRPAYAEQTWPIGGAFPSTLMHTG